MKLTCRGILSKISIIGLVCLIVTATLPMEAQAILVAKKQRTTKKYTVTIHNASSDTVIKKGGKLKLYSTAIAKDGSKGKVRYKSSNKRVISVSKKGVIKGKKKGKAKITAYVKSKGKIRSRKTITVRVGTPVSEIKLYGYTYLRAGKTSRIQAKVSSSKATNKKLSWKSSNPRVATVDSKGTVTGRGNGQAIITATAKDGSGKSKSIAVYSHKYTKDETRWIAHRGLHIKELENSAAAFEAAGEADFWGCECDIFETKKDAKGDFEIVINHDDTFKRLFGVNEKVNNLTAEEIENNSKLNDVCFFQDYLNICNSYGMVPVVEIKKLSQEGIEKMADMVKTAGLMEKAQFISFDSELLVMTKEYVLYKYQKDPYLGYLMGGSNVDTKIDEAKQLGFDGINLNYGGLTEEISKKCANLNLKLCTWTYVDNSHSSHWLYEHVVSGKYIVESITTDGRFYE